jgi:hypothetical protein
MKQYEDARAEAFEATIKLQRLLFRFPTAPSPSDMRRIAAAGELVLATTKIIEAIARPEAVAPLVPKEQLEALLDLSLQRD